MDSPRKVSCWIYGWIAVRHVDSQPFWGLDSPQKLPSGNLLQKTMENHPFFTGNSTISMVIFHSFVTNYQRVLLWRRGSTNHEMLDDFVGSVPSWSTRHQTSFWRGQNWIYIHLTQLLWLWMDVTMVTHPISIHKLRHYPFNFGYMGVLRNRGPPKSMFCIFSEMLHFSGSNTFIKPSFGLKQLRKWDAHLNILPLIWLKGTPAETILFWV